MTQNAVAIIMNELQVSRRNFSPATKMLDQAPAPSPCVSPRPDTPLTHLVSRRARGGPRFVNATPSRRPWRTVYPPAIPPSESSRISDVAPNEHLRSLVEIQDGCPPDFNNNHTQLQVSNIHRTTTRVQNNNRNRNLGPPLRISHPPPRVRCGVGGAAPR